VRLIAKGYSQVEGVDFHEIFLPVVKLVSIRTVLALSELLDRELEQLDVKKLFYKVNWMKRYIWSSQKVLYKVEVED